MSESMLSLKEKCTRYGVLVCAVSGKIGSGKTTLCEGLAAMPDLRDRVLIRNFADRLKELVALHLDIPLSMTTTHEGKNTLLPAYGGMSVGTMLQQFGSKLREVHPMFWINAVESWLEARIDEWIAYGELKLLSNDAEKNESNDEKNRKINLLVLIGDARFPNEVAWVKDRCGGITIRLEGDPGGERARSTRDLNHISETALDDFEGFDVVLHTDMFNRDSMVQMARTELFKN